MIQKRSLAGGRYKLLLQLLLGLLIGFVALRFTGLDTTIDVPSRRTLGPGTVWCTYSSCSSSGLHERRQPHRRLDGLAAAPRPSCCSASRHPFIIGRGEHDPGMLDLTVLAVYRRRLSRFLWFNTFRPDIFMATPARSVSRRHRRMAILTRSEILLILIAGLFVLETLS